MENKQVELYMEACKKKHEFEYQLFKSLKNFLKIYSKDIHFSTVQEHYLLHKLMVLLEEQIAMRKKVLEQYAEH